MMQAPKRKPPWLLLGFGLVLAIVLTVPVIAAAMGTLGSGPKYTLLKSVPERDDGAYLQVNDGAQRGVVKLYAWNFRLKEFPADAPVFNPLYISALIISQRDSDAPPRSTLLQTDDSTEYKLFWLGDGSLVPLDMETDATKTRLVPRAPLRDGEYMIEMPKSRLSSDRQYLYFRASSWAPALPVK